MIQLCRNESIIYGNLLALRAQNIIYERPGPRRGLAQGDKVELPGQRIRAVLDVLDGWIDPVQRYHPGISSHHKAVSHIADGIIAPLGAELDLGALAAVVSYSRGLSLPAAHDDLIEGIPGARARPAAYGEDLHVRSPQLSPIDNASGVDPPDLVSGERGYAKIIDCWAYHQTDGIIAYHLLGKTSSRALIPLTLLGLEIPGGHGNIGSSLGQIHNAYAAAAGLDIYPVAALHEIEFLGSQLRQGHDCAGSRYHHCCLSL